MKFTAGLLLAAAAVATASVAPPAKDYKPTSAYEVDYPTTSKYPEYPKTSEYPTEKYPTDKYPKDDKYPKKPAAYTTEVVYDYTTYCPEATTFTYGSKTYSVSEPTYVSVDCAYGCTVEKPVYTAEATYCDYCTMTTSYAPSSTYAAAAPEKDAKPTYAVTAGAAKVAGAGLAAVAGVVAALL